MEAPGVALFVHTGSGSTSELHVGFVKGNSACTDDVSGDYTFISTGLGLKDAFGMYRSDVNLISIVHSNFGFDANTSDKKTEKFVPIVYRTSGSASESFTWKVNDGVVDSNIATESVTVTPASSGGGSGGSLGFLTLALLGFGVMLRQRRKF